MKQRRVVITGLGTINSVGLSVDEFWNGLKNGKSGISLTSNEDLGDIPSKVGGEVKNEAFKPENYMDFKLSKRMDRFCHFAMAAAKEAIADSKLLDFADLDKVKAGVLVGSGIGGIHTYYDNAVKID
jgi:3-oxoacyl-[acyl-carrier-protein] synthase II